MTIRKLPVVRRSLRRPSPSSRSDYELTPSDQEGVHSFERLAAGADLRALTVLRGLRLLYVRTLSAPGMRLIVTGASPTSSPSACSIMRSVAST